MELTAGSKIVEVRSKQLISANLLWNGKYWTGIAEINLGNLLPNHKAPSSSNNLIATF